MNAPGTALAPARLTDIREGLSMRRRFVVSADEWVRRHRRSIGLLGPVLVVVGVLHMVGASTYPRYVDDPGTYLSQAWALQYEGSLSPYSYFYDHAPAGWIQIALWSTLTGGFDRYDSALAFGTECMLIAKLAATALLFALARRLGCGRIAATGVALAFGLCPLELVYGRWTFLDNLVTPWLLAAFVLAYSPRKSILAGTGAALCFAMAALTKETVLVVLPAFAWALVQNLDRRNRAQVLVVAVSGGVLLMALYPLFALYKGELLEGPGHNSLLGTARWQLLERPEGGSVLDRHSATHALLQTWLGFDRLVLLAGLAALPFAFLVRRLRPAALVLTLQWLTMARGGYVPFMHVINLLPWSVLLAAGVLETLAGRPRLVGKGWLRVRRPARRAPRLARATVAAALAAALAVAAGAAWAPQLYRMTHTSGLPPLRAATLWAADNVPRDKQLVVHDAIWTDLVHHYGFDPRPIIVYKVDTDPAVQRATRRIDYLILPNWYYETSDAAKYPTITEARKHAVQVAAFGSGGDGVRVYRVSAFWKPSWGPR
jgi:hypothetical protein